MNNCDVKLDDIIAYLLEIKNQGKGNYEVYIEDEVMNDSQILYNDNKGKIIFRRFA